MKLKNNPWIKKADRCLDIAYATFLKSLQIIFYGAIAISIAAVAFDWIKAQKALSNDMIAFGHIAGAVVVCVLLSGVIAVIQRPRLERIRQKGWNDLCDELNIDQAVFLNVEDMLSGEKDTEQDRAVKKMLDHQRAKYSDDLFVNRLSNLFGTIKTLLGYIGILSFITFLGFIIWETVNYGVDNAKYAWGAVGLEILFIFISFFIVGLCWLLTGRYPGAAKAVMKEINK